jgi:hypothetical protein
MLSPRVALIHASRCRTSPVICLMSCVIGVSWDWVRLTACVLYPKHMTKYSTASLKCQNVMGRNYEDVPRSHPCSVHMDVELSSYRVTSRGVEQYGSNKKKKRDETTWSFLACLLPREHTGGSYLPVARASMFGRRRYDTITVCTYVRPRKKKKKGCQVRPAAPVVRGTAELCRAHKQNK